MAQATVVARALLVGLLLMACAWRTHARAEDWGSSRTLWAAAAAVAPLKPRPHFNWALQLEMAGDSQLAHAVYLETIRLSEQAGRNPYQQGTIQMMALVGVARTTAMTGNLDHALRLAQQTIDRFPLSGEAYFLQGQIQSVIGACDHSRDSFAAAAVRNPDLPSAGWREGPCG